MTILGRKWREFVAAGKAAPREGILARFARALMNRKFCPGSD